MKVSIEWLRMLNRQHQCAADPMPDGIDKLVERIGAQLGAVEEVIDLAARYKGIIIAKVVSCEKHPNADKLSLCLIDDDKVVKEVERKENGLVQVVCGAPNVKAGQMVVWLPPGVMVPSTFDKDPFVLEAREIRGVISNGMLASSKELAIGDSHEGIVTLEAYDEEDADPGMPFADVFALNDHVIDIENKMFTHRPDLFGQLGIAREVAGIQGHSFKSPDWYSVDPQIPAPKNGKLNIKVQNDVPELAPRFLMVGMADAKVKPSPLWLQIYLSRVGIRPINNIVDLTNFYMMETAQPLHAYDYDKLKTGKVGVRLSKDGEELKIIGGKKIKLKAGAVVITDGENPIGLGGVMGGADTEVDENTKNIIIECGTFDMNLTRKTSMTYGLFTDASTRFTKGQSPLQNKAVLAKMVDDVVRLCGGRIASELVDLNAKTFNEPNVEVTVDFINQRLGLNLSEDKIIKLLENVEFEVTTKGKELKIKAPFWRTDIEIPEDIVEEVGRLYGYDHLPLDLPQRSIMPAEKDKMLSFKALLRQTLAKAGANEILTYSFVHGSLLQKVGQDISQAFHIRNALSPDLQYYRLSLSPSLLAKVHPNIRAGFDRFALFEIGKAHNKQVLDPEDKNIPHEFERLALVFAAKEVGKQSGAAYYQARKYLEFLLSQLGILDQVEFRPLQPDNYVGATKQGITYYEPLRAASLHVGKVNIGNVGEYQASVRESLKLPAACAGFELDVWALLAAAKQQVVYRPLNKYPELEQDMNWRLPADTTYQQATSFLLAEIEKASVEHGLTHSVKPLDIYQKKDDKEHKQITWRITMSHPDRTLTTEETNKLLDKVSEAAAKELQAERV
jgi:phenylalanyl-tRNA synthetase beta chain